GSVRPWASDWTVWVAAAFGVLPDMVSMGVPFLSFLAAGAQGNFFHDFESAGLVGYRYMHSLLAALAASGLLRLVWKPLFVPSLAWALHVIMDALTHGTGKFQTTVFYPLSTWSVDGIRWWQHHEVVLAYWLFLPAIWYGLRTWRRKQVHKEAKHGG
ncbi:MAG: hypothetical protein V2A34_06410, partial [Lentisphaerota bacterium]